MANLILLRTPIIMTVSIIVLMWFKLDGDMMGEEQVVNQSNHGEILIRAKEVDGRSICIRRRYCW